MDHRVPIAAKHRRAFHELAPGPRGLHNQRTPRGLHNQRTLRGVHNQHALGVHQ